MQHTPLSSALVGIVAVMALVAHLWMLDGPGQHGHHPASSPTVAAGSSAISMAVPGCTSGMAACHVTPPATSFALALLLLAAMWAGTPLLASRPTIDGGTGTATCPERAPPRPCVPESVVLLV